MTHSANGIIIKIRKIKGAAAVRFICKLDKKLYRCVTDNIVTDEVIITEERIEHIRKRHPNDYERFISYLPKIIESPDYILEANRPNTAFILKRVEAEGEHCELIMRLKIENDPVEYRNSVITFLRIKSKKWEKYLRNKKILYTHE